MEGPPRGQSGAKGLRTILAKQQGFVALRLMTRLLCVSNDETGVHLGDTFKQEIRNRGAA
jgi:hypothetical protein